MKILVYSIFYAPESTGIGRFTGEMVEWLASRGHTLKVVVPPPYHPSWKVFKGYSGWRYSVERAANITVFRSPIWIPSQRAWWGKLLLRASFALTSAPLIIWLSLTWRPRIVFTLVPPTSGLPIALIGARLAAGLSWLHVQDFEVDLAFNLALMKGKRWRSIALWIERVLLADFDRISSITPHMVESLQRKGIASHKLLLFRNWVDPNQIFPLPRESIYRTEMKILPSQIVALYSGNIGKKQGLDNLIDVANLLAHRMDIKIVICGDGLEKACLMERAQSAKNLIWVPIQPDARLNELLNFADIHLLPQRADVADLVMPSKLCGMLASGRPVIAGARAETQLAKELALCGVVVSPDSPRALADALVALADNPQRRKALGALARKQVYEHWDKTRILTSFEDALQDSVRACANN